VLWLEMFWVRVAEELHHGNITGVLRKRSWLNAPSWRSARAAPPSCSCSGLQLH
jgi:hypothetical protein